MLIFFLCAFKYYERNKEFFKTMGSERPIPELSKQSGRPNDAKWLPSRRRRYEIMLKLAVFIGLFDYLCR